MIFYDGVNCEVSAVVKVFEEKVNAFVCGFFKNHKPSNRSLDSRVINDPIWGSIYFTRHEVQWSITSTREQTQRKSAKGNLA